MSHSGSMSTIPAVPAPPTVSDAVPYGNTDVNQTCIENTMEDEILMTSKFAPRFRRDFTETVDSAMPTRAPPDDGTVEDFDDECEKYLASHPDFMRTLWHDRLVQRQTGLLEKHMQMTQRQHQDLTMAIKQALSMQVDGMRKKVEESDHRLDNARDKAQKEAQDKLELALTLLNERSERIVEQLKNGANFEAALKATVKEISKARTKEEENKENCCRRHNCAGADSSPAASPSGTAMAGLKSELKLVQRQLDEVLTRAVTMRTDAVLEADKAKQVDSITTVDGGSKQSLLPAGSRVQIGGYYDEVRSEVSAIMAEVRSIKWAFNGDRSIIKMIDLETGKFKEPEKSSPMRPRMRKPPPKPYLGARGAVGVGETHAAGPVGDNGISSKKPATLNKPKATEKAVKAPKTSPATVSQTIRARLGRPKLKAKSPSVGVSMMKADKAVSTSSTLEQPEWDNTVLDCEIPREPPPIRKKQPKQRPVSKPRPKKHGAKAGGVGGKGRRVEAKRSAAKAPMRDGPKWNAVNDLVMLIPPTVAPKPKVMGLTGSTMWSTKAASVVGQEPVPKLRGEEDSLVERLMRKYGGGVESEGSSMTESFIREGLSIMEHHMLHRVPEGGEPVAETIRGDREKGVMLREVKECLREVLGQDKDKAKPIVRDSGTTPATEGIRVKGVDAGVGAEVLMRTSALQTETAIHEDSGVDPMPVLEEAPLRTVNERREEERRSNERQQLHVPISSGVAIVPVDNVVPVTEQQHIQGTQTDASEEKTSSPSRDDAAVSAHINSSIGADSSLKVSATQSIDSVATSSLLASSRSSLPDNEGPRSPGEIRRRGESEGLATSVSEGEIREIHDAPPTT